MKKILLSLFVCFAGIISFCSAEFIGSFTCSTTAKLCGEILSPTCVGTYTVYFESTDNGSFSLRFGSQANAGTTSATITVNCGTKILVQGPFFNYPQSDFSVNYGIDPNGGGSCPECPTCDPQYTSEQCKSVYGLVSSGELNTCQSDLNSCQSNTSGFNDQLNNCNLSLNACNSSLTNCLQYNCPEIDYTGDLQYSNLYINDILHPGKQNIFVNIPDYITWDYNFTGDDFNLYVGSGYDVDYIESVIDINSYRPTSEDFTNIFVSGLTLVMPYIVIVLFIVFIRKLIKRIFK